MSQVFQNALGLIGNTPLIHLKNIYPGPGHLFAKAEFIQPGGSVKDRAALKIIQDAYQTGQLTKGQTVVEMTSGNMGAGLAVICAVLGNPFVAVMSAGNSPERAKMLRGLCAEVILVPQVDGQPGQVTGLDISKAAEVALQVKQERQGFYVDQFNSMGCIIAHENTTGPEIWKSLQGKLHAFVAAVGSGGTFIGTSRFLKSKNSALHCAAVEPEGSEILAGKIVSKPKHLLQGTGYGFVPAHWDPKLADSFLAISDQEAILHRKLLAEQEGLFVGFSAAANVAASIQLLQSKKINSNSTVVTILCDTGLKYSN